MAGQIRCPKCQAVVDYPEGSPPGTPIDCTGCGVQMKVPAPPKAPKTRHAPAVNNRMTPIFRQMANAKVVPGKVAVRGGRGERPTNDAAKYAVIAVGALVLMIGGAVLLNKPEPPKKPAPSPYAYTPPPETPSPSPCPTPTTEPTPYVPPTAGPTPTTSSAPADSAQVKWQKIADAFKGGGQRYEDPTRPECGPMETLKRMSKKAAVEGLLPFFDDEDPAYARAINDALSHLTGEKFGKATPANKAEIKQKWSAWAASQSQ